MTWDVSPILNVAGDVYARPNKKCDVAREIWSTGQVVNCNARDCALDLYSVR